MRWQGRRGSSNIEDRRSEGGMRMGGGGIRMGGGGVQIGGLGLVAIVLIGWFLGVDVTPILTGQSPGGGYVTAPGQTELTQEDEALGQFVSVTLADTEEVWADIFRQMGRTYQPATLVLFRDVTQSACGGANGATGPFYCPNDQKAYLDTSFFATLERQLGAKGDFAAAYVVAHEIAHHVQDELGILSQVNDLRSRSSEAQSNALSVRIELQADCFSGIWAKAAEDKFGALDKGDIAEALNAAARIGDDTLQRQAGRVPMPESFTHGTSEQRQRWFETGYEAQNLDACDTFSARQL